MFFLDIETLSTEGSAVILSAALIYVSPNDLPEDNNLAYDQMVATACFVKFDAKSQTLPPYNRTVDSDTLLWWKKQGAYQRECSLLPSPTDLSVPDGVKLLRDYFESKPKNLPVWARGSMDQPALQSLLKAFSIPDFVSYNSFRDVRTAVELIYPLSKGGYIEIPNFDRDKVIKHHPTHDCAIDALMLLRGKV